MAIKKKKKDQEGVWKTVNEKCGRNIRQGKKGEKRSGMSLQRRKIDEWKGKDEWRWMKMLERNRDKDIKYYEEQI